MTPPDRMFQHGTRECTVKSGLCQYRDRLKYPTILSELAEDYEKNQQIASFDKLKKHILAS